MPEEHYIETLRTMARLEQKVDDLSEDVKGHKDEIVHRLQKEDSRLDAVENWIHEFKIRVEEREKMKSIELKASPIVATKSPVTIFNDPKVVAAFAALLSAAAGYLIVLQSQGG